MIGKFLLGVLIGIVWGAVAALIIAAINKKCVDENGEGTSGSANFLNTLVSVIAFAAVVFFKDILPGRYEGILVGTALSMSMLGIVFAFLLAKGE